VTGGSIHHSSSCHQLRYLIHFSYMNQNATYSELAAAFAAHDSFFLISHVRPDADAIGSVIALGESLRAMGKKVILCDEDGVPESLAFLPCSENVITPPVEPLTVDVVVALDCAAKPRLGENALHAASQAKLWINIDHHKSNPGYGDLNLVDSSMPATGQILYELITSEGMPFPDSTRDAIYAAISTDTGSFQFPGTTQRTYEIAAELVGRGLNVGETNSLIYDNNPYRRVELTRALLNTLERPNEKVAHWELLYSVKEDLALQPDDSEGLIDMIRGIRGVIVAIFFEELKGGTIRVSMRSSDHAIDACEICQMFGGGGHALAAGIRMDGPLVEAKAKVLEAVNTAVIHAEKGAAV